jgi:hypothetical protein
MNLYETEIDERTRLLVLNGGNWDDVENSGDSKSEGSDNDELIKNIFFNEYF